MKYARTTDGTFYSNEDKDCRNELVKIGRKWVSFWKESQWKFYKEQKLILIKSNNPKKLLLVEDVVRSTLRNNDLFEITDNYWLADALSEKVIETITVIYTKNNKGNLIRQWQKTQDI